MKTLDTDVNTSSNLELFHFTQGLDVDQKLFKQEIRVQKSWARALAKEKVLSAEESLALCKSLDTAQELIEKDSFPWKVEDEDIHMNLERFLTQELGELGKKIHIGRSRNDLIATTLRLFISDELETTSQNIKDVISAVHTQSTQWLEVLVPGMTHLQFGQPIRFGHLFAAHGFAFKRDLKGLNQAQDQCTENSPLGAAAFGGTHLGIELHDLSKELGFQHPLQNSYDAVSDRDYMIQSLNAYALVALHVSRMCEDLMFWSSSALQVLQLPYDWSTGSSIMPNKRNPDVLELSRGKMARVISAANEALILSRSVTPSYGSDLHELKRTFIKAHEELNGSLSVLKPFILGLKVNRENTKPLLEKGHVLATDIANTLTETMPFRQAYQEVAKAVASANENQQQVHHYYQEQGQFKDLSFESSIESRKNIGGTALASAKESLAELIK